MTFSQAWNFFQDNIRITLLVNWGKKKKEKNSRKSIVKIHRRKGKKYQTQVLHQEMKEKIIFKSLY